MAVTQETLAPASSLPELSLTGPLDRRSDVDAKQALVAAVLRDVSCDGLLVLNQDNLAWLTSGGVARGVLDPNSVPALYFTAESRWALCANVDSQRLFDEELERTQSICAHYLEMAQRYVRGAYPPPWLR